MGFTSMMIGLENGTIVLLFCAIGSRFLTMLVSSVMDQLHLNGFQVDFLRGPLYYPMSLYDIQLLSLSAIFLEWTAPPQASLNLICIGCE